MNSLNNISIQRLEEINKEREETESNPQFQQWIRDLNVGRMWLDKTLILNAKEVMREWDISRFRIKC